MSAQDNVPQESVYDFLPKEEFKIEKIRYVSKFRPTVLKEEKLHKRPMQTMGPAKVEVPSPQNYVKKHSKEPKVPETSQSAEEARIHPLRKPPVPSKTIIPPLGIHTKRDFIKTCTFTTTKPQPICVDSHKGHKEMLENSGLVPKYIKKKDFGSVPVYLQHRNAEKQKAQEEFENFVKEQREKQAMKQLTEVDRQQILEGLRKNWDKLHHEYQGLSVVIDTWSKRAQKERLETEMARLEKDIKTFERFKIIYVSDN